MTRNPFANIPFARARANHKLVVLRTEAPAWVIEALIPYIDDRIEEKVNEHLQQASLPSRPSNASRGTPTKDPESQAILRALGVDPHNIKRQARR